MTWASNVAETQSDRPQSILAKPDQARSNRTTNNQANGSTGNQHAHATPAFPKTLINIIGNILGQPSPAPMTQEFTFKLTKEAAAKNFCVLKKYGLDLGQAIDAQKCSPLTSEEQNFDLAKIIFIRVRYEHADPINFIS